MESEAMMRKRTQLPKPDGLGNYWFGEKPHCIVIFHSASKPGKFFASTGEVNGVLLNSSEEANRFGWIKLFDTPEEALAALRQLRALP